MFKKKKGYQIILNSTNEKALAMGITLAMGIPMLSSSSLKELAVSKNIFVMGVPEKFYL